jgi:ribose 5-phosphate isomerase B
MVAIGSDHAGYDIKCSIIEWMTENQIPFIDYGTDSIESVDYPDFAHKVSGSVVDEESVMGVLICGSGNGVCMTANKWAGIRAALCWNEEISLLSRTHNNANVICLPARFIDTQQAIKLVDIFFDTEFEGGRHEVRTSKINPMII